MSFSASERKKILSAVKQKIVKKYGNELIVDSKNIPKIDSISTGSLKLDFIIGCNGWPRGRISELRG